MLARSTFPLEVSVVACLPLRVLADEAARWWDFCERADSLEVVRERASMPAEDILAVLWCRRCRLRHDYLLQTSITTTQTRDNTPNLSAMRRGLAVSKK